MGGAVSLGSPSHSFSPSSSPSLHHLSRSLVSRTRNIQPIDSPAIISRPSQLTITTQDEIETISPKYQHDYSQDGWVMPTTPSPKTWKVTPSPHRTIICRFCGGKSCKREDYTKQTEPGAIRGLHSTWVSANVIGMQRPSSRLIKQHDIIKQFKDNNVGAIFNLQANGEHPHCGDGIHEHGFSYRSEEFTDHGISYYAFGWTDMGVPTMDTMLQIVQVMSYHTEALRQKIAVHCHAGYGRTGIAIACFFLYAYGIEPKAAIESVRHRRDGSIETSKQVAFVYTFAASLSHLRTIFYDDLLSNRYTLSEHLSRQRAILHGIERDTYKSIPKLVHIIITRLQHIQQLNGNEYVITSFIDGFLESDMTKKENSDTQTIQQLQERKKSRHSRGGSISMLSPAITPTISSAHSHTGMGIALTFDGQPKWSIKHEDYLVNIKKKLNIGNYTLLQTTESHYITQILLDWCDTLQTPIIPCLGMETPLIIPDVKTTLDCIPSIHLSTCHMIFTLLISLKPQESTQYELYQHLLIRWGWALMQPPCALPEICAVRTIGVFQLQSRQSHPSVIAARATFESGTSRPLCDLICNLMISLLQLWNTWYDSKISQDTIIRNKSRIGVIQQPILNDVTNEYLTRALPTNEMMTPSTIAFVMNNESHDVRKYEMCDSSMYTEQINQSHVDITSTHYTTNNKSEMSETHYIVRPVTALKLDGNISSTADTMYHIKSSKPSSIEPIEPNLDSKHLSPTLNSSSDPDMKDPLIDDPLVRLSQHHSDQLEEMMAL